MMAANYDGQYDRWVRPWWLRGWVLAAWVILAMNIALWLLGE